ncbi:MAG: YigZ family protein [Bacillota bacterium]|nr:YigZ family protein [Bacillota bacterium]
MDKSIITVAGYATAQFIEKKSRFIGHIAPVADEAQAQAFIERIRAEHREANHNVYAWLIGEQAQFQRSSDDGEPSGSAGRPVLEALKRSGLQDAAVVVTRYFGGILLGAGGLARAYGKGAQLAIEAARRVKRSEAGRYALDFDYTLLGRIEPYLFANQLCVENKLYGEKVCFICLLTAAQRAQAETALAELSNGSAHWQDLGETAFIETAL